MQHHVRVMTSTRAKLGEGPLWCDRDDTLYWVDIIDGVVHAFEPTSEKTRSFPVNQYVSTVVPRRTGGLILALQHGIAAFDTKTGIVELIVNRIHGAATHRFNDGKCDPAGRMWVGTISLDDTAETSALYRIDANHGVNCMCTGVTNSNGVVWSLDQTMMYYIDTPTRQVSAFDYDVTSGDILNRRVAITIPAEMGYPDGMAIDAEGNLWIALWGGSCVSQWDPIRGKLLGTITLPTSHVTSCAFGGSELRDLYITTARFGLDDATLRKQPLAGALFRVETEVPGVPAYEFAG